MSPRQGGVAGSQLVPSDRGALRIEARGLKEGQRALSHHARLEGEAVVGAL